MNWGEVGKSKNGNLAEVGGLEDSGWVLGSPDGPVENTSYRLYSEVTGAHWGLERI